jgi:hypothetical protein
MNSGKTKCFARFEGISSLYITGWETLERNRYRYEAGRALLITTSYLPRPDLIQAQLIYSFSVFSGNTPDASASRAAVSAFAAALAALRVNLTACFSASAASFSAIARVSESASAGPDLMAY